MTRCADGTQNVRRAADHFSPRPSRYGRFSAGRIFGRLKLSGESSDAKVRWSTIAPKTSDSSELQIPLDQTDRWTWKIKALQFAKFTCESGARKWPLSATPGSARKISISPANSRR